MKTKLFTLTTLQIYLSLAVIPLCNKILPELSLRNDNSSPEILLHFPFFHNEIFAIDPFLNRPELLIHANSFLSVDTMHRFSSVTIFLQFP